MLGFHAISEKAISDVEPAVYVSLTQTAANVTASGGTQTIVAERVISITQTHATITATGGVQSVAGTSAATISQTAATITATGGTQSTTAFGIPIVTLDSPSDAGTVTSTTPELYFTGTDSDSNDITYEVQVDTVDTFDSSVGTKQIDITGAGGQYGVIGYSTTYGTVSQSITPASAFSMEYIDLPLDKVGSPTDNLYLTIDTAVGGSSLGTSNNVATSSLSASPTDTYIRFTFATPVSLSSGVKYYVTPRRTGSLSTSNYIRWLTSNGVSDYSGGGMSEYGTSWGSEVATKDGYMRVFSPGPLIDALSATDAGFADITTPADTDPFASGDQIGYTVQAGDALTDGTTYYWRVRGKDPSGSNTWGSWATTRSFDVSVVVNASVTQVSANITATGGTQGVNTGSTISISQTAASVTASGGTQSITTTNIGAVTQTAATITASGGAQSVQSLRNVSISQSSATVTSSGGTQSVSTVNDVSITQVAGVVTTTGGNQSISSGGIVSISQTSASVTVSGGTQSVTTVNDVSLSQSAGSVTATGGTQSIQSVRNVQIAQSSASVTASGGTQSISSMGDVSISQLAANITAYGGIPTVHVSASVLQVAANIIAYKGTPSISSFVDAVATPIQIILKGRSLNATLTASPLDLTLAGQQDKLDITLTASPLYATISGRPMSTTLAGRSMDVTLKT